MLHEAGHGIYDQGLRPEWYGLPPGEAVSLGIHESQSRLWENLVGRSRSFWNYFYEPAQKQFPEALGTLRSTIFTRRSTTCGPRSSGLKPTRQRTICTSSCDSNWNRRCMNDELKCADLPGAWKEKYQHYLGIAPPDDRQGVLQDIHWSAGLIGYFPTYSLGNLYASQFFELADQELGGLDRQFAAGAFQPLADWLRDKIHRGGQCYTADELVQRVTGQPLSHAPLMRHLRSKFGPLFGV